VRILADYNPIESIIMKTSKVVIQAIEDTSNTLYPESIKAAIYLIISKKKNLSVKLYYRPEA
jgi:DNA-binding MurR/RpiR family transcriptional regulator